MFVFKKKLAHFEANSKIITVCYFGEKDCLSSDICEKIQVHCNQFVKESSYKECKYILVMHLNIFLAAITIVFG